MVTCVQVGFYLLNDCGQLFIVIWLWGAWNLVDWFWLWILVLPMGVGSLRWLAYTSRLCGRFKILYNCMNGALRLKLAVCDGIFFTLLCLLETLPGACISLLLATWNYYIWVLRFIYSGIAFALRAENTECSRILLDAETTWNFDILEVWTNMANVFCVRTLAFLHHLC